MIGSEAMGAPPYKGEQRTRRSHHLRARSRPNLPSYESLYGLSRTGLRKRPSGGKCRPLRKIIAALTGIHRRFIARATVEGARRSPCKAESCTIWLPGSSCGSSSAVKLVTSWRWERKGKLWHKRPTDLTFSL